MKNILFIFLFISSFVRTQTLIAYDYIETFNWGVGGSGWAVGCGPCWYSGGAFVSSNLSAALIGSGNGSSPIESGTYILSNITGLNTTSTYTLKFRAGSYKLNAPSAGTAGNDVGDYFDVQYSSNNSTYVTEMRITGFSGALWNYNLNATASKNANGTMTTYTPVAGGDRTTTGDGYSLIQLTLPVGVTQLAFRIPTRSNSAGEEWWFDNFELWEIPQTPLPIELESFFGEYIVTDNVLKWSTVSESNADYYLVEKSTTGDENDYKFVGIVEATGNSNQKINYQLVDKTVTKNINYYRLRQYDIDGVFEVFGPISIDNRNKIKNIYKVINLFGQDVDDNYKGIVIVIYDDGTSKKIMK
jgi:hypothetical protein